MTALTITGRSTQATKIYNSNKSLSDNKLTKIERGGAPTTYRFTYTNTTGGALADGSIVELGQIGDGLVLPTSVVSTSAFGAGRTLDVGLQEYRDRDGTTVASDIDAFLDGLDVSAAVVMKTIGSDSASTAYMKGVEVKGTVSVLAKVIGGTLPANGTIDAIFSVIQQ